MGISIGLVGLGSFGSCFAPLFKNHCCSLRRLVAHTLA